MISIHKALTSLDCTPSVVPQKLQRFQSTRLSRASTMNFFRFSFGLSNFNPQGSHEPRLTSGLQHTNLVIFQSTRLSRASTAKIHNYPCIHAKFIYLNYTPSTNHPASQKIFSYFNPIFRPFAVRIPLEFYVQLLFAPEFPY